MPVPAPAPDRVARFAADLAALSPDASGPLGLAVSGGPDSLALLLLAHAELGAGAVKAATVDHGLRAGARAEAEAVASLCARLGVPHSILPVTVDPARSSVQRAAREARYAALDGWMTARGLARLATAHHADDQAETLLMRLLRGSGVRGLAGVRPKGTLPVPGSSRLLVRPLLGWRRAELAEIVADAGLDAAADPSNADPRFDRVRLRSALAGADWIDPAALSRSAAALAEADEALDWATDSLWIQRVTPDGAGLRLDPSFLPPELLRRLVLRILERLGPGGAAPRGDEVGRLLAKLAEGGTATLAGVRCRGGASWTFAPEGARRSA